MATFLVLLVSGPKVTVLVAILKSLSSAAVPVERTSTVKVVDAPGRWLTVTGTFRVAPATASDTVVVYFTVDAGALPKAILAVARSLLMMVIVAAFPRWESTLHPLSSAVTVTVKVSDPSTSASAAMGMRMVSLLLPTVTVWVIETKLFVSRGAARPAAAVA